MVIIPSRVGQLGNQLFHTAHFAASAIEYGYRVWFSAFEYSLANFPNINSRADIRISEASIFRNRYQHRVFKVLETGCKISPIHQCFLSHDPPYINTGTADFVTLAKSKLLLCEGFGFRDPESVRKHRAALSNLFTFSEEVRAEVDCFETKQLGSGDRVRVGFHIRRGDYSEYKEGRYFLNDDHWLGLIAQVRERICSEGCQFIGIVFSNEDVGGLIASCPDLIKGPGGTFTDLEMLSRCDRIVAPPSTYSGWASFVGGVPLHQVEKSTSELDLSNSEVVLW